jgi:heptosyltransferase-1
MPPNAPGRILVVKLSAIGDVLMATPVARALRTAFPESHIAWVVEKKAADVVLGNPHLDEVIVWERTRGGSAVSRAVYFVRNLARLRKTLRSRRFDVCLDLQGLMRSAVVCRFSGARRRIGFADGDEGSVRFYHETYDPGGDELNAQQRNLDILRTLGVISADTAMQMPLADADRAFAAELFESECLAGGRTVAFCPATTWANKHWVPEGWSQVADLLRDNHGARSVVLGSKADLALASRIAEMARSNPVVTAGRTTLKEAGAIMERCDGVIGVDTGLLHMAVALDRPTVGLFGASAWRCFLRKDSFVWVAKEFPCSPCQRHPTCKSVDCMRAITAEDVEQAVRRWL